MPLHLLITAYELKELRINPYYFTLHITVDNASTGHAKKALQSLYETMPALANTEEFFRRVDNGYKLNQLGLSTNEIIDSFNLDNEFLSILKSKSYFGQRIHSDSCRFNGRTINEWLSDPSKIPDFVDSLIENSWIKRNQNPQLSRFWKLIEGNTAKMFGVFSGYEKQVIYDWIAGNQYEKFMHPQVAAKSNVTYLNSTLISTLEHSSNDVSTDPDVVELERRLATADNLEEIMQLLVTLISPALHHSPAGLVATQLYKSFLHKAPAMPNSRNSFS